jgi:hypothetical protein
VQVGGVDVTPQEFIQRARVVHELRPAYVIALRDGDEWICAMTAVTKTARCVFVVSPNVADGGLEFFDCVSAENATDLLQGFRLIVGGEWERISAEPTREGLYA